MSQKPHDSLPLVENDPWLWPVASCIENRHDDYLRTKEWISKEYGNLYDFASSHLYYGLHYKQDSKTWVFREWLPQAKDVFLVGEFNGWDLTSHPLHKVSLENGDWEVVLDPSKDACAKKICTNTCYKIYVHGADGKWQLRMPAYTFYTEQDNKTKDFNAKVWEAKTPKPHKIKGNFENYSPLIYEVHIGMSQEKEGVGTYKEFTQIVLPRIKDSGYNTIQLMGIAEHPYYGSFGYHVSNFFAPSSRFGTPEDLIELIQTAHEMGILVLMDIVHAHFVPNLNEGLLNLDGSDNLYNYSEPKGTHPYWGSKMFDYSKNEVKRFLLSNLRYWMENFGFDGFRFDGVTAMIYFHRGYVDFFGSYSNYFGQEVDNDAIIYLRLANDLIKEIGEHKKPSITLSIAEEVSGMPGITSPCSYGGFGFDYRLSMGIPDFWIKLIKEKKDEDWVMEEIWRVLNDRLPQVPQIAYCESHDQALVGDQTLSFRLMGSSIYTDMVCDKPSLVVDRGLALHKMIRLITLSLGSGNGGYLNFMGNEFGHPEWIDFPREGNNWSYAYARRQWSLALRQDLKYRFLLEFDKAMILLAKEINLKEIGLGRKLIISEEDKTIAFDLCDGRYVFVFNWHTKNSIPNYRIPVFKAGSYSIVLSSDDCIFGGFGRVKQNEIYYTQPFANNPNEMNGCSQYLSVYNINRTVQIWKYKG